MENPSYPSGPYQHGYNFSGLTPIEDSQYTYAQQSQQPMQYYQEHGMHGHMQQPQYQLPAEFQQPQYDFGRGGWPSFPPNSQSPMHRAQLQQLPQKKQLASRHEQQKTRASRLNKVEVAILEAEFQKVRRPSTRRKVELAGQLHVSDARINNWFQNRRAKEKLNAALAANGGSPSSKDAEGSVEEDDGEEEEEEDEEEEETSSASIHSRATIPIPEQSEDDFNFNDFVAPIPQANQNYAQQNIQKTSTTAPCLANRRSKAPAAIGLSLPNFAHSKFDVSQLSSLPHSPAPTMSPSNSNVSYHHQSPYQSHNGFPQLSIEAHSPLYEFGQNQSGAYDAALFSPGEVPADFHATMFHPSYVSASGSSLTGSEPPTPANPAGTFSGLNNSWTIQEGIQQDYSHLYDDNLAFGSMDDLHAPFLDYSNMYKAEAQENIHFGQLPSF